MIRWRIWTEWSRRWQASKSELNVYFYVKSLEFPICHTFCHLSTSKSLKYLFFLPGLTWWLDRRTVVR
jgi:hypothetical protein